MGRLKMHHLTLMGDEKQGQKMQDWTMTDEFAGVDTANWTSMDEFSVMPVPVRVQHWNNSSIAFCLHCW